MGLTELDELYEDWRDADAANDEKKLQGLMEELGARQIGAALYEDPVDRLRLEIRDTTAKLEAMQYQHQHLTGRRFYW